jgi:S-DNA-T family DNA segregation ATPase FtsK/SpoIIIE
VSKGRKVEAAGSAQSVRAGLTLWRPITVGVDEHGERVTMTLPGSHVAIGGETGGGKSGVLQMVVAAAAFDPDVELVLLDGKRVELAPWERCASRSVWWNVDDAISVLDELQGTCERRLERIVGAAGIKRKVAPGDGLGLVVVAIDELALYCTASRKAGQEFSNRLRLLVQLARATGIIVVAATQRPSHDVIPTSLRDLFPIRWALRCPDRGSSDIVLGPGWAARGFSAADIPPEPRGVGLLLHERGLPRLVRACYLSDADLEVLIPRAEALRRAAGLRQVSGL